MSKPYNTIKLKKKKATIWITLNRSNRLNAINATMLEELSEALKTIEEDPNVRCLIITGEGERAFSTGADIAELHSLTQKTASEFSRKGQQVLSKIEELSKPAIAAIKGSALGGGLELALVCDFRLASCQAELGFPEMKLGVIPGWGGTQRLAWTVGVAEAKRLILMGDRIKADEALRIGLVDKVVPQNKLEAEAEALAQRLCENLPTVLKHAKYAINFGTRDILEAGFKKETSLFALLFSTKETRERLEAFISKRNRENGKP